MLSYQEAVNFASDVLKVSVHQKESSLSLLNELIFAFYENVPFQSVTLQAIPLEKRRQPTLEEAKTEVLSGRGGLCYTVNTFMKYFTEALGFNVRHICSSIKTNNDHIMTIAEIDNEKYLIDVGSGYPTFEAIPINFEKESKVYQHSFLEYKFAKEEKDESLMIIRLHKKGDFRPGSDAATTSASWRVACIIDPMPRDLSFFDSSMSLIYSSSDHLVFHTSLRIILFPNGGQALVLRDKLLYKEDSNTHELVIKKEFDNFSDIIEEIKTLFPLLYDEAKKIVN
ncbi:PREDICTED: uncharacterized protein LOC105312191 isoform X2 [Amphimedon queenslandica]|uniref:arylamine N-acetyltransferase n=2 Tax=Amphimedon queenslandica TaxID=400682 RepID=A0AAN0IZU2_AMPQE|nr:PREDICTED: uncharacterized protein LOC105312191 isoform X1 [Amphimedon queenslandica]XP_019850279.1 PREDICTED: uncharacterized protein LOC105312191 isoform X2 [Amphimedon queenslandica]|eukprot:XP_011402952.2 PREDICTED: uncharacterized protein LOC105312191 isoform X1 [Amphimedon queenslandica]